MTWLIIYDMRYTVHRTSISARVMCRVSRAEWGICGSWRGKCYVLYRREPFITRLALKLLRTAAGKISVGVDDGVYLKYENPSATRHSKGR